MRNANYWKKWVYAAGIRAVKTFCQSLVTLIGTKAISIIELDWKTMLCVAATTAIVSILTSIAGLPEVSKEENTDGEVYDESDGED
jgi:hypothetical protein